MLYLKGTATKLDLPRSRVGVTSSPVAIIVLTPDYCQIRGDGILLIIGSLQGIRTPRRFLVFHLIMLETALAADPRFGCKRQKPADSEVHR